MRVVVAAGVVFLLHALSFGGYVADDAGISLAYAKNLAEGHGLVLTPGGERVEGYSNPLWVFVLAAAVRLGADPLDPQWLLNGLGLALGLATLFLVVRTTRVAYGPQRPLVAWFAPAVIVLSTSFTFWAVAGLENALYAFAICAALLLYLREMQERRGTVWSALALAAVALTRPEGVAIFIAFAIHRAILVAVERVRVLQAALWAATFVVSYGSFLFWRHWYFASWLPNTYYAKLSDRHLSRLPEYLANFADPGWKYVSGYAADAGPLVLLLAAAGLMVARHWRVNLLLAGVLGAAGLYVVYVGGDWWPAHRFISPVVPLIAVAAQQGLAVAVAVARRRPAAIAIASLAVAAALHANAQATASLWTKTDDDLVGLKGRWTQAQRIRHLAALAHVENPTYLETDIGGPALAGGLRVIDLGMLADVHLARFQYYPAFFRQYIFEEQRPHFIRTHSVWTRASRVTDYPEFARDYLPIESWRDEYGLHGEFVRKDLFVSPAAGPSPPLARWGEVQLVSFRSHAASVPPGQPMTFTWSWQCVPACQDTYMFHVRVEGARQGFAPVFGWYAAPRWGPGEIVRTTHRIVVPSVPAGDYAIEAGVSTGTSEPAFSRIGTISVSSSSARSAPDPVPAAAAPGDVKQRIASAEASFASGLYDEAMRQFREVLLRDPRRAPARRRLEDARERSRWIEYLYDTDRFDELRATFAAPPPPTVPGARELQEDFEILRTAQPAVVFEENGRPTVALLHWRSVPRPGDLHARVRLYFKVLRTPRENYQLWLHTYSAAERAATGAEPRPRTWGLDPRVRTRSWRAGDLRVLTYILSPAPGEYELRGGFWQPRGSGGLCPQGNDCYVPFGHYRF